GGGDTKSENFFYLLQRKTEAWGFLDKLPPPKVLGRIHAVIRHSPARPWDQPPSLVVTQGFDVDLCLLCEFANGKAIHLFSSGINLHPVPRYGVKSEPHALNSRFLSCRRDQKEDPRPGYGSTSTQGLSRVLQLALQEKLPKSLTDQKEDPCPGNPSEVWSRDKIGPNRACVCRKVGFQGAPQNDDHRRTIQEKSNQRSVLKSVLKPLHA